MELDRLDWILLKAQSAVSLTEWESRFIDDFTDRREELGDRIKISERQEEILEHISEKD